MLINSFSKFAKITVKILFLRVRTFSLFSGIIPQPGRTNFKPGKSKTGEKFFNARKEKNEKQVYHLLKLVAFLLRSAQSSDIPTNMINPTGPDFELSPEAALILFSPGPQESRPLVESDCFEHAQREFVPYF